MPRIPAGLERGLPYVSVAMVRPHMRDLPKWPLPSGYGLRAHTAGDEAHWARVETAAGEFPDTETALRRFQENFHGDWDQLERCFYLTTDAGEVVGTATASSDPFEGDTWGRVSWVGITPAHQGHGLAKPLLAHILRRIAADHERAFLTTQTTSARAVALYTAAGFVPRRRATEEDDRAWALIGQVLGWPQSEPGSSSPE